MNIWLDRLLALTCHQLPERSPQYAGIVFPVCFRLAGFYLGALASYVCIAIVPRCPRAPVRAQMTMALALIPFLLDGWGNTLHLWSSPPVVRAFAGLLAGIVLPLFLVPRASIPVTACGSVVIGSFLLLVLWHPGSLTAFVALAALAAAGFALLVGHLARCATQRRLAPEPA